MARVGSQHAGRGNPLCALALGFPHDGRVELDTNSVQRTIRSAALGRKKHLFVGSDGGEHRWAMAFGHPDRIGAITLCVWGATDC
ncbi:transposase [Bradyrhizobium sp. GCM10023182]|uniref:IS66 family transposase n=1 Tax=Bradyrhizobium TaxID=374 RepID=UPI0036186252